VVRLYYEAGSGSPEISYINPKPLSFTNDLGCFALADGQLSIEPTEHFSTEAEARQAVASFLRAWEISADLESNPGTLRFTFSSAEVIDRAPPTPGMTMSLTGLAVEMVGITDSVHLHLSRGVYPEPPEHFQATPDVELAFRRWLGYREGREPLQSMAYFVLTVLERKAGDRKAAANVFAVDPRVLRRVGQFSSERGDPETARKAARGSSFVPLTGPEEHWLEQAVRRLVQRLGEHAAGGVLPQLTMTDLPTI
jgi:hypothetical protein